MAAISLLGIKIGMTQIFNDQGNAIPVTVLKLGPCLITQIKTQKSDNYEAIQIGYLETSNKKLSKAEEGHLKNKNLPNLKHLQEYRIEPKHNFKIGQLITTQELKIGDIINVSSKKIGKGFMGYQKRHKFTRGPMSHGSKNHRQPGSIGAGTTPGRVFPGKKMAGRAKSQKVTIRNLKIIDIKHKEHLVIIKGSVPGKTGNLISINKK